jgi:hypothetical protein
MGQVRELPLAGRYLGEVEMRHAVLAVAPPFNKTELVVRLGRDLLLECRPVET